MLIFHGVLQLHLTELDPIRPEVLFQIWSAPVSAEQGTVINKAG